jgi:ethanolamine permease
MSIGQSGVQSSEGAPASSGITYNKVGDEYFEARKLKRHARVWSLWALGVGAVISGHYSGWNLGLAQGFGAMFIATIIIAIMYLGLTFSLAEMSPALPHTGGAYSFARTAMGPWAGYITGIAENIEFVLTPAVIVFFIGSYLSAIFGTDPSFQPVYWVLSYALFVALNVFGVELSFRVTVTVTLMALAVLAAFYVSVLFSGKLDFSRWALNIGADGAELPNGGGSWLPTGIGGVLASLPFAVWLFLAIEQLPLAAEESHDPQRDMPKGIIAGICTLIVSAFLVLFLNSGIAPGAAVLAKSGEPLLDGFRTLFGTDIAKILAAVAVIGLIASFHTIIFAFGRQIYSLSRAGYFPSFLSVTHGTRKTPHLALIGRRGHRSRGDADHLVLGRVGGRRGRHRRHTAQHGGCGRDARILHAGHELYPAQTEVPAHQPPVCQPVRRRRRGCDDDHRGRHAVFPVHRSGLPGRRRRSCDLLRRDDGVFPAHRPSQAHPLARGGICADEGHKRV